MPSASDTSRSDERPKGGGCCGAAVDLLTGQDKIFRVVLDPSCITPGGFADLGAVGKDLIRKMDRV